ncbi:uncharacterized protein [Epargyreus clarus]|uniref:uncharacterized protein n=1 Tax=Epargyreus clarus TaxID=520877 RepID=UPI003C2F7A3B
MESNLTFFSLPFVDSETSDLAFKSKGLDCDSDLNSQLQLQTCLSTDDVLAHFLTADGPLEEPDLNGPTTLHCEICAKQFDNAKKYYGHLRVHSKDYVWKCDKCPDQKFSTKQQLMKHSLSHKPLARVWKCPQCTMVFEALWRLQQHLFAKHLHYMPHKCDQCEKAFHKLSDLKKHQDVHSDIRKHPCPTCDMRFKDKSNLKRHMLSHTNEKPFSCSGCGNKFKQVASLNRHKLNCPLKTQIDDSKTDKVIQKNQCRLCGMIFPYKVTLIEHCVKHHTNTNNETNIEQKQNQMNIDANRTVDNIVDDILSAEDDYLTMSTQNEMLNPFSSTNLNQHDTNTCDNLMQIEFLKEMNLYSLDDELLYNDIDFDTFQSSHMFNMNTNDIDYCINDRNTEIQFDFSEAAKSVDQDIMNALSQVKDDHLPDEFLNVAEMASFDKPNEIEEPPVLVNDCATIFESDVDLDASTNLAANLNQLIGENNVQYISTEHDDTFIISLRSEIDAEQLTDMLNIGVEVGEESNNKTVVDEPPEEDSYVGLPNYIVPIIVEFKQPNKSETEKAPVVDDKDGNSKQRKTKKKCVLYICRKCSKVFKKKDNYKSHMGTHKPELARHVCGACGRRFAYRSSLTKHRAAHAPRPPPRHACDQCERRFTAAWMLRIHVERDHERRAPHACARAGCRARFYKRSDLATHERYHTGERPFSCDTCSKTFPQNSHLKRHKRSAGCIKLTQNNQKN